MEQHTKTRGFTLIELLIVVAIIAILAAIAVPNFLEAQVRAKVSRAQADMRSLATALEAYCVDNNRYPISTYATGDASNPIGIKYPLSARMAAITTPVAFMTSIPRDPFLPLGGWNGMSPTPGPFTMYLSDANAYDYFDAASDDLLKNPQLYNKDSTRGTKWRLASAGPDRWASYGLISSTIVYDPTNGTTSDRLGFDYDPTNGTTSNGDIVRLSGSFARSWSIESALK